MQRSRSCDVHTQPSQLSYSRVEGSVVVECGVDVVYTRQSALREQNVKKEML